MKLLNPSFKTVKSILNCMGLDNNDNYDATSCEANVSKIIILLKYKNYDCYIVTQGSSLLHVIFILKYLFFLINGRCSCFDDSDYRAVFRVKSLYADEVREPLAPGNFQDDYKLYTIDKIERTALMTVKRHKILLWSKQKRNANCFSIALHYKADMFKVLQKN